jgi:hypothetical protein
MGVLFKHGLDMVLGEGQKHLKSGFQFYLPFFLDCANGLTITDGLGKTLAEE